MQFIIKKPSFNCMHIMCVIQNDMCAELGKSSSTDCKVLQKIWYSSSQIFASIIGGS